MSCMFVFSVSTVTMSNFKNRSWAFTSLGSRNLKVLKFAWFDSSLLFFELRTNDDFLNSHFCVSIFAKVFFKFLHFRRGFFRRVLLYETELGLGFKMLA